MQNKKGQTLGLAIMSSVVFFIIGMMMINFLMPEITTARAELDCTNATGISDGVKLICLATDSTVPYWIMLVFSVAIGGITRRFILS